LEIDALTWKSEAAFSFENFLTGMNETFEELEDAGQPLFPAQKV
jgi:hypothetical protein